MIFFLTILKPNIIKYDMILHILFNFITICFITFNILSTMITIKDILSLYFLNSLYILYTQYIAYVYNAMYFHKQDSLIFLVSALFYYLACILSLATPDVPCIINLILPDWISYKIET